MENVSNRVVYNKISDGLKKEIREALPKKGQTIWFISSRPKSRGTTVPNIDRIFDPYAGEEISKGKFEGAFVDIGYVTGQTPGKGDVLGRIQFTRSEKNMIGIRGGDVASERLFSYLYLSNSLKNNKVKAWFVPSAGRPFTCEMQEPAKSAQQKNDRRRKVVMAFEAIDNMGKNELFEFALGLNMAGINKFSDEEEVRAKLGDIAEKDPEKVLNLNKDESLKMMVRIKKAEQYGIIQLNKGLSVWEWPESGEAICMVPPGKAPKDALTTYLLSEKGSSTLQFIQGLVNKKDEDLAAEKAKSKKEKEKEMKDK